MRRNVVAPLFALLLVASMMGAPLGAPSMVEPAAATHECSDVQQMATFTFGLAGYATDQVVFDGKCTESHTADVVEQLEQSDANQTKLDIYNAGIQQRAETDVRTALYRNYLNDTESAAWMQAEMAIAAAYSNGSAQAVAESKAISAIQDYYSVKQLNYLEEWNVTVQSIWVLHQRAVNESAVPNQYVDYEAGGWAYLDGSTKITGVGTTTVTLANGSTTTVKTLEGDVEPDAGTTVHHNSLYPGASPNPTGASHNIVIGAPNSDYSKTRYLHLGTWNEQYARIQSQNDALQAEVSVFVDNTWDAYQSGQINASDVISRNTQMFRYGETTANGEGNLYSTVAALSAMGLDTPQLNGTGTMAVTYQGVQYHGLVMARSAPNGSWQANTTYNASTIPGPVFMATTGGEKVDLTGEFTIGTISSESGAPVQNVTATKVVYKTSNTSELLAKMQAISDLRKEVESRQQSAGDGSGSGVNIDPKYLLGALAIIGLLAYAQQNKRE